MVGNKFTTVSIIALTNHFDHFVEKRFWREKIKTKNLDAKKPERETCGSDESPIETPFVVAMSGLCMFREVCKGCFDPALFISF